jgi:hypothetical protein
MQNTVPTRDSIDASLRRLEASADRLRWNLERAPKDHAGAAEARRVLAHIDAATKAIREIEGLA